MTSLGNIIAGLGAVASGYVQGDRMLKRDEQEQEDRAMRRTQFQNQQDDRARAEAARISLANAARPAAVTDGATLDMGAGPKTYDDASVAGSDFRQARNLGLGDVQAPQSTLTVNGKAYGSRADADAAAAAYNSPEATDKRITLAMAGSGDVKGAKAYEASARQSQKSAMDLADQQWKRNLGTALKGGHQGIADFVSRSEGDGLAQHKVQAVPSADGKTVTYSKVNDDGSLTPLPNLSFSNDEEGAIRAAYMLDRTVTPQQRYSNMLTEEKTKAAASAKVQELELKKRQLEEVSIPNMETRAQLAEIRANLAQARAAGGADKIGREERMRYTTLFTDAGRRMNDAQKSLRALLSNPLYSAAKPGSPQAQEMDGLRSDIKSFSDERELYGRLLATPKADSAAPAPAPSLSDAKRSRAGAAPAQPAQPQSQDEYDKLPKGAKYLRDGQVYVKN